MIKAPYNFVPLENAAFYPEWANHISQDIPFEDGVSGCIEYTMEAKTPIFVRNGYPNSEYPKKGDKSNPDPTFSHIDVGGEHRYFISGTSVKGEIRNVLEILSFGKMTRVQDARFGIRTLRGKDQNEYVKRIAGEHCGWLIKGADGIYRINDCETPGRIDTSALSRDLNNFMHGPRLDWDSFCQKSGCDKTESEVRASVREEIKRSSLLKYFIYGYSLTQLLDKDFFADARLNYSFSKVDIPRRNPYDTRMLYRRNENGDRRGTIVLTGQPSSTKKYDFIFFDRKRTIEVQDDIIADFKSIHKNNLDFKYVWEPRLESGKEIPVFFTLNLNSDQVIAIGLSGMFRIPSANFIRGAIPAELQSKEHKDLAECIFGTADKVLRPLKGRVVFSPAFADGEVKELDEVRTTLSSPKPSYGPLYVNYKTKDGKTKGGTWNSSAALIKGRKRYPVLGRNGNIEDRNNNTGNGNTETKFRPLAAGTVFSGKIYFHNLRRCELGALISAMTFNGHSECFHSIGEAKPLGYGKVKTTILKITDLPVTENDALSGLDVTAKARCYLNFFEGMMDGFSSSWKSPRSPLSQLFAMAKGIPAGRESEFTYMRMSTDRRNNEFAQVKGANESLTLFSEILEGKKSSAVEGGDWERVYAEDFGYEIEKVDKRLGQRDEVIDGIERVNRLLANNDYSTAMQLVSRLQEILNMKDDTGTLMQFRPVIKGLDDAVVEGMRNEERIRKDKLQSDAENLLLKANDSKDNPSERKIAISWLDDAISKCNAALSIKVNLEADVHLYELIRKCEKLKIRIINVGKSLQEAFNGYRLASMAAFAGKVKSWKTDSGVEALSEENLTFLGNFIKDNLGTLRRKDQKPWLDYQCWNKNFASVFSPEDIDYMFNIVSGD